MFGIFSSSSKSKTTKKPTTKPKGKTTTTNSEVTTMDYATKSDLDRYARKDLMDAKLSQYLLTSELDAKLDARLPARNTLVTKNDLNTYVLESKLNDFVRKAEFNPLQDLSKYALKADIATEANTANFLRYADNTSPKISLRDKSEFLMGDNFMTIKNKQGNNVIVVDNSFINLKSPLHSSKPIQIGGDSTENSLFYFKPNSNNSSKRCLELYYKNSSGVVEKVTEFCSTGTN